MRNYDNYAKQICRNFIKAHTYPLVAIYSKGMAWIKGVIEQNFYENQILVSIWCPSFIFNTNIMGCMHISMFWFFVARAYVIIGSWFFFNFCKSYQVKVVWGANYILGFTYSLSKTRLSIYFAMPTTFVSSWTQYATMIANWQIAQKLHWFVIFLVFQIWHPKTVFSISTEPRKLVKLYGHENHSIFVPVDKVL